MPRVPPDIAQLSLWQVERALASVSEGEKIALMKIARLYARKTPYDKEDLVQEAFARVLAGRRAWTKGTGPVLFLGGVIRISAALPGNGRARGRWTRHPRRIGKSRSAMPMPPLMPQDRRVRGKTLIQPAAVADVR